MATTTIDPAVTKYCPGCGKGLHLSARICPDCGAPQPGTFGDQPRNRIVAALLALIFGGIGIHKFYLGRKGAGALYLIFCLTLIPALLGFIDAILLFLSSDASFHAKYD